MRERRWLTQAPQIPTTLHPTALVLLRSTILWQHKGQMSHFHRLEQPRHQIAAVRERATNLQCRAVQKELFTHDTSQTMRVTKLFRASQVTHHTSRITRHASNSTHATYQPQVTMEVIAPQPVAAADCGRDTTTHHLRARVCSVKRLSARATVLTVRRAMLVPTVRHAHLHGQTVTMSPPLQPQAA
jgi:hypothetical protein